MCLSWKGIPNSLAWRLGLTPDYILVGPQVCADEKKKRTWDIFYVFEIPLKGSR